MSVALLLWRARLRRSWRTLVVLGLLFALGGGVALAVAAGARRTASANEHALRLAAAPDFGVSYSAHDPAEVERRIGAEPSVDAFTQHVGYQGFVPSVPPGSIRYFFAHWQDPIEVDRPIVLEGRFPIAGDEAFLNEEAARRSGLGVGDRVELVVADATFSDLRPMEVDIVGVGLVSDEVVEDETGAKPAMLFARPFAEAHPDQVVWGNAQIKVRAGADVEQSATRLAGLGYFTDELRDEDRVRVQDAIRPLVVTLAGLSLLGGVATLVVVGQAVARLVRRTPADERSLAAVGSSRRQLTAVDLLTAATVAVAGAVGAVAIAVGSSTFFPVGRVRRIEDLRGIDVDVTALAVGATVLVLATVGLVGVASWRARQAPLRLRAPGVAPGLLAARPARSTGVRFATGRGGVVGTVAGLGTGLAVVVAALTFTGSLARLLDDPALAGFEWDVMGRVGFIPIDTDTVLAEVGDDPSVERITALTFVDGLVAGAPIPISVWGPLKGSPWPPVVAGRAPEGPGEIMVGPATLDRLDLAIGDTVTLDLAPGQNAFGPRGSTTGGNAGRSGAHRVPRRTIVGTAISPAIGMAGTDTPRLDEGVLAGVEDVDEMRGGRSSFDAVLFDLADGTDPGPVRTRFADGLPNDFGVPTEWFTSAEPSELSEAAGARTTIALGIAALLIGVVAAVGHSLLTFVRQRRAAFAVLKALGFTPRQIRTTVLWQSGVVVTAALLVAVPVGIAAGRWLWQAFAEGIGVIAHPTVPFLALAATVIGTVLLVEAASLVPARRARRTNVTMALKAE